jgi:hypothetical protein
VCTQQQLASTTGADHRVEQVHSPVALVWQLLALTALVRLSVQVAGQAAGLVELAH